MSNNLTRATVLFGESETTPKEPINNEPVANYLQTASWRESSISPTLEDEQHIAGRPKHLSDEQAKVLVRDLGSIVRKDLARCLDPPKVLAKNWQELADCYRYTWGETTALAEKGKTMALLDELPGRFPDVSVGDLHRKLIFIGRADAADQLLCSLETLRQLREETAGCSQRSASSEASPLQSSVISSSSDFENDAIQAPNVYVLFSHADKTFFTTELKPRLDQAKITFFNCHDDPRFGSFFADEHSSAMNASRKLIVVLSDDLFCDKRYAWLRNQAHCLDRDASRRKIIPVIYKEVRSDLNIFRPFTALDKTKMIDEQVFWKQLIKTCSC